MSEQVESEQAEEKTCPECHRILKPGYHKKKVVLMCRYCNYIEGQDQGIDLKQLRSKNIPIPKECPECWSKEIVADSYTKEGSILWRCKNEKCLAEFEWKKFTVIYAVEVTVECCPEDVKDVACELIDEGETELMGYWEEGTKNANLKLKIKDKDPTQPTRELHYFKSNLQKLVTRNIT